MEPLKKEDDEKLPPEAINAKKKYFKSVFDTYDMDKSGHIEMNELTQRLRDDLDLDVPTEVTKAIFLASDTNKDGRLNAEEFNTMVHNKKFKALFGHYIQLYMRYILPRYQPQRVSVDGAYDEQRSCCPPPIFILIITFVELLLFIIDQSSPQAANSGLTAQNLIYDPYNRQQFWRYITYMFVHVGYTHLIVNLVVQVLLAVPLEMVHTWRVSLVYLAGVLAGSLANSTMDPSVFLAGASGGVYALLTAHIGTILMNWKEMTFAGIQLALFLIIAGLDISVAIYNRFFFTETENPIGYMAHFGGGLSGLLMGIWALRNFRYTSIEKYIWWSAFVLYVILMFILITLNIFWKEHFQI